MTIGVAVLLAVLATSGSGAAGAQPASAREASQVPDLSGTWKLDPGASTGEPTIAYAGLGGNAARPTMLYVTHAKNGTVIVGSNMNTSRARTYQPGGESKAPFGEGELTMRSRWVGAALVSEGRDAATGRALGERLSLSSDGGSLVVEIRATAEPTAPAGAAGEVETRLVYRRATAELPCEEWSTPCKDWSQDASTGEGSRARP